MSLNIDVPGPEMTDFATRILGNDYLPEAIARFRRCVRFNPADSIARDGLELARKQVFTGTDGQNFQFLRPESELYPAFFFNSEWFFLGFASWLTLCVLLIGMRGRFGKAGIRLLFIAVLLPIALVPTVNELVRHHRSKRDQRLPPIVVIKKAELRTGNGFEYPSIMPIPRGTECRMINQKNRWIQVEFSSGLVGWIPKPIALVIPYDAP